MYYAAPYEGMLSLLASSTLIFSEKLAEKRSVLRFLQSGHLTKAAEKYLNNAVCLFTALAHPEKAQDPLQVISELLDSLQVEYMLDYAHECILGGFFLGQTFDRRQGTFPGNCPGGPCARQQLSRQRWLGYSNRSLLRTRPCTHVV